MNNTLDHYGLIIKTLRRYRGYANQYSNVDHEDLIQEGWLAIVNKIDGHDPKRGAMSTYLMLWINDAMYKFVRRRSVVRRPIRCGQGMKLSDYTVSCCEFDEFVCRNHHDSPEDELEASQEVRQQLQDHRRKFKWLSRKSNKYHYIDWILKDDEKATAC